MKIKIIEVVTGKTEYQGEGNNYAQAIANAQKAMREELAENGMAIAPMQSHEFVDYCNSLGCNVVVGN